MSGAFSPLTACLAAWSLGIQNAEQLSTHSMRGALFESWVIQELLKGRYNLALVSNIFFWRDIRVLINENAL